MSDVTRILSQIEAGDPSAAAKLAREKPGQTLQATALVHEAYLRLLNVKHAPQWDSCGHFFSARIVSPEGTVQSKGTAMRA